VPSSATVEPFKSWPGDADGTALNRSHWVPQTSAASGFGSQDDCFVDDPDNIAVSGGTLTLSVRKEAAAFTCTTPASTSGQTNNSAPPALPGTLQVDYVRVWK